MDHVFLRGIHHQKVDGRSPPTATISETVSTSTGGTAVHECFFEGHVDVMEESKNRRLAHVHVFFGQAHLKLRKSTIRLFGHEFLNSSCMILKRESLVPAKLVWSDTARFALTLDESTNSTQSHVVQLGNFHTGVAGFDRSNDTFAQIVGIRLSHS